MLGLGLGLIIRFRGVGFSGSGCRAKVREGLRICRFGDFRVEDVLGLGISNTVGSACLARETVATRASST